MFLLSLCSRLLDKCLSRYVKCVSDGENGVADQSIKYELKNYVSA